MKLRGESYRLFELEKGDLFYYQAKGSKKVWQVMEIERKGLYQKIEAIKILIMSESKYINKEGIKRVLKNEIIVYLGNTIHV